MRVAQTEAEVNNFKEGIVRMMSNLTIDTVKEQYMANKDMFDNHQYSVHDYSDEDNVEEAETMGPFVLDAVGKEED